MALRFERGPRGAWTKAVADAEPELAFLGAACLLTESACVVIGRRGNKRFARLTPRGKAGLAALEDEFSRAYRNQVVRWRLLSTPKAAPPAGGASFEEAVGTLPKARRDEIAKLLAEPEIEDVLGVKRHWEDLRR